MSLDSFLKNVQKGFKDESKQVEKRKFESLYRNIVQRDEDRYYKFSLDNDITLLRKYSNGYTSNEDKAIIASVLESRGYRKNSNGGYSE